MSVAAVLFFRRRSLDASTFAVLALLLAPPGAGLAQLGQRGSDTISVSSQLVVVDVTATDDQGQPVVGLDRSQFTISEDGAPQTIRNFDEIDANPVMPMRGLPPNVYTNLQPAAPSPAVNILLLDLANEAPIDSTNLQQLSQSTRMQKEVKDAAIAAIEQMPTGTRVAVLAMTYNLRTLESFTSDRDMLEAAIRAVPYDLDGHGDKDCVQSDSRNRSVLEALDQIAVSTQAIRQRKNLIWFTVGIPAITDPSARPGCLPDYARGLSNAYTRLTAAQVSVYPVDVRGARMLTERELSEQSVAAATGGMAYSGSNDMTQAVLKAFANGSSYYSIAYVPPREPYDGRYHRIEVKTSAPGVHLVFRTGYYADDLRAQKLPAGLTLSLTPPPAPKGDMKAAMSRGEPLSDRILFDVGVTPIAAAPVQGAPQVLGTLDEKLRHKPLHRYAFQYTVPMQQISFASGPGNTHRAALDFDLAVYDDNDRLLTGLSQNLHATLTDATWQKMSAGSQPIRFTQQIDLPPGQLFIRVGVLDRASDKNGTLELPLTVARK